MEKSTEAKRSGTVTLIGRPNTGKSTLINAIIKQKVAITSPKPQTTRFAIHAVYEDGRGQILFTDTPGIFGKVEDLLARRINIRAEDAVRKDVDVVLYIVDHTRYRDYEENKTLGMVRKMRAPKILVINKIDVSYPSFEVQYKFMEQEFDAVVKISALNGTNIPVLLDVIYRFLPEREPAIDTTGFIQPGLNINSKTFIAELIREKAFLNLRRELPYTLTSVVDEVVEKDTGTLYVKARILTSEDRYKAMIIGKGGSMIKEISMAARKELEVAANKKVYVDLTVETDPHWMDYT
jgi:GTP-binding protein Era